MKTADVIIFQAINRGLNSTINIRVIWIRISQFWKNTLNSRCQVFRKYYRSKQISDVYKKLLEKNPPQMPRTFPPTMIENETKEEMEMRTLLSVEKFKSEIHLQDLHSEKYEIRLNNVDANMITCITANYENDICDNLIELWDRDCKKEEEKSIKIFHGREEWYLNNTSPGFRNAAQSLRQEKSQYSKNSIHRERRKTMIAVSEVEVTTNITHINPQQTNSLKMIKKNGLH